MDKPLTSYCHTCGCIEGPKGWVEPEKKIPRQQLYVTLCKNCLSTWTDGLIADLREEKAA